MTIKPAKGLVFARPSEKDTAIAGFLIAEDSAEAPHTAEVIHSNAIDYQTGDVIVYKPYTTTDIKLDNVEYFLIDQEDVLGKVEND
jgi:chaperonin GroES